MYFIGTLPFGTYYLVETAKGTYKTTTTNAAGETVVTTNDNAESNVGKVFTLKVGPDGVMQSEKVLGDVDSEVTDTSSYSGNNVIEKFKAWALSQTAQAGT